ncbi:MAG: alpha/beta hydrolase domain-containing protein [Dehalococcoidia bacterium]
MAVVEFVVQRRTPYAGGQAFGEVGAYERVDGIVRFAVDPSHPANQAIVDLGRAERDPDGLVRFEADFCVLQPVNPARANGLLLFDVLNRGSKGAHRMFNRLYPAESLPTVHIPPGDGWLFREGWTLAWCGWQWDVLRSAELLGLSAPQALEDGEPIQGEVIVQFQPSTRVADHLLSDAQHAPYPAAGLDQPDASLTTRGFFEDDAEPIGRVFWRFAHDVDGRPEPDETSIWLDGGFEAGRFYELRYRTRIAPVVGTGLLAVRDFVSYLRGDPGSPAAGAIRHTIGFGRSQSGRFLRHFLWLGLNLDERGRQVFDGVFTFVAGARRGEFNHRFGQPSVQYTRSFGHLMPFAHDPQVDPITAERGGLLDRQRELGGVPRLFEVNTAAEYWRGDCSLLHCQLADGSDVEPPAGVRVYCLAGTGHFVGSLPLNDLYERNGQRGCFPFNTVDYRPLLRAALTNLALWVVDGVEPPPSVFPRAADSTRSTAAEVIGRFGAVPGLALPNPARLRTMRRVDLGPQSADGIGRYPASVGAAYPAFVCALDETLNERGGIAAPDVAVPLASYTGWDPRHPSVGGHGQIVDMFGATVRLPWSTKERTERGDPRPAVLALYRDRADYLARVRQAAEDLAGARFLRRDDLEWTVEDAGARWDAFAQ